MIGGRPSLAAEAARRGLRLVGRVEREPVGAVLAYSPSSPRVAGKVPVLLVVDGDDAAVAAALDDGADDAVPLTASDALIAARLAALVRRSTARDCLRIGELMIDQVGRRVLRAGRPLDLLPREYRLLLYLAERAGQVVPRTQLRAALWGLAFDPGTNVVAVHISRLRAKLDRGFAAAMLLTEKGIGYRLAVPGTD